MNGFGVVYDNESYRALLYTHVACLTYPICSWTAPLFHSFRS